MKKKKPINWNIEKVREFVEGEEGNGCKLLSEEYINNSIKMLFECQCGNKFETKFSHFTHQNKKQCNECGRKKQRNSRKKTNEEFIEEVYDLVGDEYTFLEEYVNAKTDIMCRHNECGYVWKVRARNVLRGHGCPRCAGNLKKTTEQFEQAVYNLTGGKYIVLSEYVNSKDNVMIRHNECGYEWSTMPTTFLSGCRCPRCAGSMKKTNKEFIREVYDMVGAEYTFLEDYVDAKVKLKCRHNACSYEWDTTPDNFLSGMKRCPRCNGGIRRTNEEFVREVYELVGEEYIFLEEFIDVKTKIKCRHNKCKNEYYVKPNHFFDNIRCPQCNMSKGEDVIRIHLKELNIKSVREYRFNNCKNKNSLPFDFYLPTYSLIIEYDGEQHYRPVNFGGMSDEKALVSHKNTKENDKIKDQYCKDNNIPLLRIPYWEFDNIEEILENWLTEHNVLPKDEGIA